jgi:hypothetical protein
MRWYAWEQAWVVILYDQKCGCGYAQKGYQIRKTLCVMYLQDAIPLIGAAVKL